MADHGVGAIMGGDGAEDWAEVLGSWARTLQDHLGITTSPEIEPEPDRPPAGARKPRLTKDQKSRIVALSLGGKEQREIARLVGCGQATVSYTLSRHRAEG